MQQEGGDAILVHYDKGGLRIALPLIIRPIGDVPGLSNVNDVWDATSVYGYVGPVITGKQDMSLDFQKTLYHFLTENRIVALFSRLHPLLHQLPILNGLGDQIAMGPTVSIDLTTNEEVQIAAYRKSTRYEVRKAQEEGVRAYRDGRWEHFDRFIQLYHQTMERVGASDYYLFDRAYFEPLRDKLGLGLQLFVAELDGQIISASLFFHHNHIIQYHLSGSDDSFRHLAASKLIIDATRQWGITVGAKTLHLGGGVGAQRDGLWRFKKGFSDRTHTFSVWKYIVIPEQYQGLIAKRSRYLGVDAQQLVGSGFFPAYRADLTD